MEGEAAALAFAAGKPKRNGGSRCDKGLAFSGLCRQQNNPHPTALMRGRQPARVSDDGIPM